MDTLHLKAPQSWFNDPNGFIYYKGKYHLFFQHFPHSEFWGTMHWGHAVTEDLVHWEHLGVALFPTKHFDANGVFSGGALEVDGKMNLYYTGVRYYAFEPQNSHAPLNDIYECTQVMISSEDGIHFDNYKGKQVIFPVIYNDGIANFNHTRDPKVWKQDGMYYMVLGSTYQKEIGRLLVCKSTDAEHWSIESVLADKKFGRILECPDLFELNGQTYLLISPMYIVPKSEGYEAQSMIGTADFDPETCKVSHLGEFTFVDHGRDLYATQSCLDEEGRRVFIAWLRMPEAVRSHPDEKPWNGMMCVPRVIEAHEDGLYFTIHPNVKQYFDTVLSTEQLKDFCANQEQPWMLETTLCNGEEVNIGGFRIWMENETIHTDRTAVLCQSATNLRTTFALPSYAEEYQLSIIVEPNVIEIYVDGGKHVLSNVIYGLGATLTGKVDKVLISSEQLK